MLASEKVMTFCAKSRDCSFKCNPNMSGYFSTYGPRWLNPTQLVRPFCREASRLCSRLRGRVVRDGASCECCGLQSCGGGCGQSRRRWCKRMEGLCETFSVGETMSLEVWAQKGPLNCPWAFCFLFSALLSLPPPALCRFSGWVSLA